MHQTQHHSQTLEQEEFYHLILRPNTMGKCHIYGKLMAGFLETELWCVPGWTARTHYTWWWWCSFGACICDKDCCKSSEMVHSRLHLVDVRCGNSGLAEHKVLFYVQVPIRSTQYKHATCGHLTVATQDPHSDQEQISRNDAQAICERRAYLTIQNHWQFHWCH